MTAAIYAALQAREITYSNPPASFETTGQRIRLPDRILDTRLATCLDLALLAAACIEQAGLHPLVVLVRDHAFVGVWLGNESFPEPASDEPLRLRKRVDLKEIAVFDPTCVTAHPTQDFERAEAEARRRLEDPDQFACTIDVARARKGRIRPLPERVERGTEPPDSADDATDAADSAPRAPDVTAIVDHDPGAAEVTETAATRLDQWRRKLLDLTLRNRLLNFRETKKTIPLLCPDLPGLEDALAGGATYSVLPKPDELSERNPRDPETQRRRTGDEALAELLAHDLRAGRLRADLTPEELDRRMLELYRAARLGLEEGGASALSLAVGFLSWYEHPSSETPRLAPILLLPLELRRRSVREGFTLHLSDDDARINVTLLEMLRKDHGIAIDGIDPPPEDESGLDVPLILRTVRRAIRDVDRWDVLDAAQIGIFSFAKFLMWRDLSDRADDLMRNALVEHLVHHPDDPFDPGGTFPEPECLDDEYAPTDTFCPLPTDSSQLAAVIAAADGRTFVLEGPPGTGKSQTITNLIAHCLAEGRTVLFVSEKMAALNVVHDRLQKTGLGRHCLELHSNKSQKRAVLGQLEQALDGVSTRAPEEWSREARRLEDLRNELNAYVRALHARHPNGESIFQVTSRLIGLRDVERLDLSWSASDAPDHDRLNELRDVVERLVTAGAEIGDVEAHAWSAARHEEWTPGWAEQVRKSIDVLGATLDDLEAGARAASERLSLPETGWSLRAFERLDALVDLLADAPTIAADMLERPDWDQTRASIGQWIGHGTRRDELRSTLFARFDRGILDLDLADLLHRARRAATSSWPLSWLRRRPARRALRAVATDGRAPAAAAVAEVLEQALALRSEEQVIADARLAARDLLGRVWNEGEPDWIAVGGAVEWCSQVRSLATGTAGIDLDRAAELRGRWARLVTEGRELLGPDGHVGQALGALSVAWKRFTEARAACERLLHLDADRAWGMPNAPDALATTRGRLSAWRERSGTLRDWCAWRRVRTAAIEAGLAPFVDACERGAIRTDEL
ncbi:MAG: DUF4011 domain-containing protein, partial [Planctomycetes bacterium]|nr:DUF4011 domain-containing protein [Planctomycetota bacterium]